MIIVNVIASYLKTFLNAQAKLITRPCIAKRLYNYSLQAYTASRWHNLDFAEKTRYMVPSTAFKCIHKYKYQY